MPRTRRWAERRLLGLRACRNYGIGFRSVEAVVHAARCRFVALRVRSGNLEAGSLYERLGFVRFANAPDCTNLLWLGSDAKRAARQTRHDVR